MTSKISLIYEKTWQTGDRLYTDTCLPSQRTETIIPDADELTTKQLFYWFTNFLRGLSYGERSIATGAMEMIFNADGDEEIQKWICDQYELTMNEDLRDKFEDFKKTEEEWARLEKTTNEKLAESFRDPMGTVITTEESTNA